MPKDDYQWYLEHDLLEYAGKWIAIRNQQVVVAHSDLKKLIHEVTKKFKLSDVFLAHIPQKDVALVYKQC